MKCAAGKIAILGFIAWFSFITAAIDTLHNHGPFDDDPLLDWYESELCELYLLQHEKPAAMEASPVQLTRLLGYCPASTYLAASTGRVPELPADVSFAMMILGSFDQEKATAPKSLLQQLPTPRSPPIG